MLNLFAATGQSNYANSARLDLQLMKKLPTTFPALYEQFIHNVYLTVRRRNRLWSGIWTDLATEQVLMCSLKTLGCLTRGSGMTENVILTWVHTMHACAQSHNVMRQLTGNHHKTSNQHSEVGVS